MAALRFLIIFSGLLYLAHKYLPKGFVILQVLFSIAWSVLDEYNIQMIFGTRLEHMPIFWIVSSIIVMYIIHNKENA